MKYRLSFLPGDHIILATTKSVSIYETKSTVEAITDSFSISSITISGVGGGFRGESAPPKRLMCRKSGQNT